MRKNKRYLQGRPLTVGGGIRLILVSARDPISALSTADNAPSLVSNLINADPLANPVALSNSII